MRNGIRAGNATCPVIGGMRITEPPPWGTTYRVRRTRVAALLLATTLVAAGLGDRLLASSTSAITTATASSPLDALHPHHHAEPREQPPRRLGAADGAVPEGTSVFDDTIPGVTKLDPALLMALRRAAADAPLELVADSGWRSPAYQRQLLRQAVLEHGSAAEAARWVAAPDRSAHVSGDAVDVGPRDAAAWLGLHGAAYGLCRVYANEPWHYELRPGAGSTGCPPTYPDPTYDPRLQR